MFSKVHDLVTNSDNVECHFETHNKEVKKVAHKASSSNKDGLRIYVAAIWEQVHQFPTTQQDANERLFNK